MNHLTEEKIDLYILNKKILGKEAEEIKLHLAECDLCKNVFNKLNNYYNKLSSLSEEKGSLVTINKSLESRSIEGIQDLNFILNRKKPNENKDRANIFDSFILFIKSLFLPVPGYSPAYKFIGPLLIIVIAVFLIYYFNKSEPEKYKASEEKKIDTTKQIEEKKQYTNIDTLKKEIIRDTTKVIEKEKKKTESSYSLLAYADIESGTRGGEVFKFISLVSKKSGIAELVVYKREKKIDLNEDTIKHCLRTGLAKLYSFPRTEVNKGLEIEQNRICNVDLTADGDYDVYVSETGNINNCWENEALRYKFDKNFNLKQIEYSEKFNTTYQKLQSENKINISVSVENHLSNIKSEFKGINK